LTGEEEDTDVGFPGPEHHIAERELPMQVAMGGLAVLAVVGGALQIPGVDEAVTKFLDPTFADSGLARHAPSNSSAWVGLIIGAVIAVIGIAIAYRIWGRPAMEAAPGAAAARAPIAVALQQRLAPVHTFLVNKWYFDELIDFTVVRPALWVGRFAESVLERVLVAGVVTGGAVGIVRAGSAAVRRAQTGFLRFYAAAIVIGMSGTILYFLISSS
jgi:NADH-quinone oxidoreductase subunit L